MEEDWTEVRECLRQRKREREIDSECALEKV